MPLSGPAWVSQFPGSNSTDDLVEPFRTGVESFLAALRTAGADVTIAATFRPPQRAYLMHYSFLIAGNQVDPKMVPPMSGVDIQWLHPRPADSHPAAVAMAAGYKIVHQPVLASQHTLGLAIDMDISWQGNLTIVDATGLQTTIGTLPRNGANRDLHGIGETFGVIKLATDPPHWSSDGR